jgi:hypothetical protein
MVLIRFWGELRVRRWSVVRIEEKYGAGSRISASEIKTNDLGKGESVRQP